MDDNHHTAAVAQPAVIPGHPDVPSVGTTSWNDLVRIVLTDPQLTPEQKKMLVDELRKTTPTSDRWTFRWAIWILGLVVILAVIALWVLSYYGKNIPDGLVAIGSGAAGGLAGLLTPGRSTDSTNE